MGPGELLATFTACIDREMIDGKLTGQLNVIMQSSAVLFSERQASPENEELPCCVQRIFCKFDLTELCLQPLDLHWGPCQLHHGSL